MIVLGPWPRTTRCLCEHARQARCHTVALKHRRGGCRCPRFRLLFKIRQVNHKVKVTS